jgi:hypothetical protein
MQPSSPYPPPIPTPEGVIPGTKAIREAYGGGRPMMTPEDVRRASNEEHDDLQRASYEVENGYNDPVDPGPFPWSVYARTYVRDDNEAREYAVAIALQLPRLRSDPAWANSPWIGMPLMTAAYHIELVLRKSIGRLSLIEALMSKVGMFSPDTFIEMAKSSKRQS